MSMESKATLLGETERELSKLLTAVDLARVMSVFSDRLEGYSVERAATGGKDGGDDLLEAYLNAMTVQGLSPKTIQRYRYALNRLMNDVKTPTRQVTVYHLRGYLTREKQRGISDRTLDGNRQVFSAYFNWLQREGLINANPTANLGPIKYQKKEKIVYSPVDLDRLNSHCKSVRDRAIVCFLRATGCRISEMTQLNRGDVDLVNLECTVLGKGNKQRVVFIDQVTAMVLQLYLTERQDNADALFVGRGGNRLLPGGVRQMLVKLGRSAQVEHVHPHKFRRTTATTLIRHGMPVQEVAAILGHEKLDTTMQYVVIDKTDIKNAYRKYAS